MYNAWPIVGGPQDIVTVFFSSNHKFKLISNPDF